MRASEKDEMTADRKKREREENQDADLQGVDRESPT
jgi:hypothetical protein